MALRLGERVHVSRTLLAAAGLVGIPCTWNLQIEAANAIGQQLINADSIPIGGTIFVGGAFVIGEVVLLGVLGWITTEGAYRLGRRMIKSIKDRRTHPEIPREQA